MCERRQTRPGAACLGVPARRLRSDLDLVVDDDGEGFERANGKPAFTQDGGFGLFAIREMSSQMGGSFEIDSAPGNGTFAVLTVPLS